MLALMGSPMNAITDVAGILVGHHHRLDPDATMGAGWASGVTVVLTPPGTVGAVDVPRRGARHPGNRSAGPGQQRALRRRGVDRRRQRLRVGGRRRGDALAGGARPRRGDGRRGGADRAGSGDLRSRRSAAGVTGPPPNSVTPPAATAGTEVAVGTVGAGVGACAGVLKGGVGTASTTLPSGVTVGALVVVNSAGNVVDQSTGLPWLSYLVDELGLTPPPDEQVAALAAARIAAELAEHHHRGGRDRRRAEPGGLPARREHCSRRACPQHPAGAHPGRRRHGVRAGHRRHRGGARRPTCLPRSRRRPPWPAPWVSQQPTAWRAR